MKVFAFVVAIASVFYPVTSRSAETANARIWCLSVRFQEGTDSFGDTLDLSTISSTVNGELAPYNQQTYISGFTLDISGFPVNGTMKLNLPPFVDVNGNGFHDFFESSQGVSATTTGTYTAGSENGTVTATWQRAAGSANGSCSLHLVDNTFGDLGSFNHVFSILEYTGPLLFTPGSNTVTAGVNLTNTSDSTIQIQGPVQFVKVSTNRFNQLILQPGNWTNTAAQTLSFTNDLYQRVSPWTTNYYGLLEFADGDPNTAEPDYLAWVLSIDDLNDANHNGIPDFSDDPTTGPPAPTPPQLVFTLTSTNLLISLSGDVGHRHNLQQTLSIPATNWQTVVSLTLTNNPQVISISNPAAPAAFWRALAH